MSKIKYFPHGTEEHDSSSSAFIESIGAAAYLVEVSDDNNVRIVAANSRAAVGLDATSDESRHSSPMGFWSPGTVDRAVEAFRECVRSNGVITYQACLGPGLGIAIPLVGSGSDSQRVIAIEIRDSESLRASIPESSGGTRPVDALLLGRVHDARNLVTPILGWAELFDSGHSTTEEAAQHIIEAAAMISALLEELMSVLMGEPESAGRTDPNATISDLVVLLEGLLGRRITVVTNFETTPAVALSADRLKQVVLNLAINARDAMPMGGRLSISTKRIERLGVGPMSSDWVAISITDTGMGMEESARSRAFDAYFSSERSSERRGIGLWAVANIVQLAGGDINLRSEPRFGTTVEILLPASV